MTSVPSRAPYWLRRLVTRALRRPPRRRRSVPALLIGLVLIAAWQWDFSGRASSLDDRFIHRESSGMNQERRFVYFLYYLGLYPVVTTGGHAPLLGDPGYRKFRPETAARVIAERGQTLSMESGQTIRAGDMGRALLYLPYAMWTGKARYPRLAPTHAVAFSVALGALYAAFWWLRDPVLGALAVALLGSNPYQLHEVHARENVFGWAITAGILTLAASLPLLSRRGVGRLAWLLPVAIGALLGTVRQIRPEPVTIIASVAAACLLVSRASWWRRAALAAVLLASFLVTSQGWLAYFDHKFEEARQVVSAAGGKVYQGPRDRYHTFWHPLWCGLGDFGQKYGYEWRDKAAAVYAGPIVKARYQEMGGEPDLRYLFWDPVYDQVVGEKVMHDITHDPLWYLGVLARRVRRVLTWTTPVRLAAGPWSADLRWTGLATVPLIFALAWTRSWPLLKIALFPLGTSLPAVLVFSGTVPGQSYTGWFHIMGAAIVLGALVDVVLEVARRQLRARAAAIQPTRGVA